MRGKIGYHRQSSNKHNKKKLVQVLLDSGSDGDLVFVDKDNTMLLPYLKRLIPQSWNTSNAIFHTKHTARVETSLITPIAKGTMQNQMLSSMMRKVSRSMTSFLARKP